MPTIVLLSGAQRDSLEIFTRLESRSSEAADLFYRRLDESLGQICEHPESAPIYERNIRRLIMRGHPLGIFFTVEGERLMVLAILDLRQNPTRIRQRLELDL